MADAELAGLSREELLELVRRQQEELAERAACKRRAERMRALEEELAQFRRPVKTPANSSGPPSRGQQANRAAGRRRKQGPKRGPVGVGRLRSTPDVVIACRPSACAGCGELLPQIGGRRVGQSPVTELPSFAPVVIEGWQYALTCAPCGIQTTGWGVEASASRARISSAPSPPAPAPRLFRSGPHVPDWSLPGRYVALCVQLPKNRVGTVYCVADLVTTGGGR